MTVRTEKNGHVTTIIIDRPAVKNAVDHPTAQALARAFREFEADADARAAVLWGAGGTFCSGADLKALSSGVWSDWLATATDAGSPAAPMGPSRMTLHKPVIAAVSGYAVAGGLELALMCDLRVVEEDAVFGVFCRRWGVPLVDGGTVRLPRVVGMGRALDMILTGRPVDAREALGFGLANRVVPKGAARPSAERLADEIGRFPQTCLRSDRRSAYEQWGLPLPAALANEARLGQGVLEAEAVPGASRFSSGSGRHGSFETS